MGDTKMSIDKIKICHLTSTHKNHDQRILIKECVTLSRAGYDVYQVAQGDNGDYEGVHLIGTGERKEGAFYRLIIRPRHVYKKGLALNADIYQIHDMELLPYAVKLKRKGKKVIFDYHEDYAMRFIESDVMHLPKAIMKIISTLYSRYEKRVISKIDAMISVTPNICDRLARTNRNTVMITNYPSIHDPCWGKPISYDIDSNYICFTGQISPYYCLSTALAAIQNYDGIQFKICGPERRGGEIKQLNDIDTGSHLQYLGNLPFEQLPDFVSHSIASIVTWRGYDCDPDRDLGTLGVNKLFESMLRGVPVICTDSKLWSDIVKKYNCGICVKAGDYNDMVNALEYLLKNRSMAEAMGQNGRTAVFMEFNWESQEPALLHLYEELVDNHPSSDLVR
jgi:glycosyltransferase involved in cell wall biosynthesis